MQKILPITNYRYDGQGFTLNVSGIKYVLITLVFLVSFALFKANATVNNQHIVATQSQIIITEEMKQAESIKKFISTSSKVDNDSAEKYAKLIVKYSAENNIDPYLMAGLIKVESRFNKYAISGVGALGLTQIMPEWHKEKITYLTEKFGYFNPFDPEHNIAMGTMIFAEYKQLSKGNKVNALLRYNGSLHHSDPTYAKDVLIEHKNAKKWEIRT